MKIFKTPKEMTNYRLEQSDSSIGYIPTMGALHQGHFALVKKSLHENQITVVSIYVNETQFDDPTDLQAYPSSLGADLDALKNLGVAAVFIPIYKDMYPNSYRYKVSENELSKELCGRNRPGHFDGVLTVVMKLLNIVSPQRAYFGEKDYQQLQLIKGMAESFFISTQIIAVPTERSDGGLALSSRNKKLSDADLKQANFFAQQLKSNKDINDLRGQLNNKGITVDYLVEKSSRRYAAVKISNVRLIDNVEI